MHYQVFLINCIHCHPRGSVDAPAPDVCIKAHGTWGVDNIFPADHTCAFPMRNRMVLCLLFRGPQACGVGCCSPSFALLPKDDKKKKDSGKSAKKDKDPVNKSGGKAKKKKWSKGKIRDKLNYLVLFDKATYNKLCKEVPNYRLRTPTVVSERLKIQGSLARAALQELLSKGLIKLVSKHRAQEIYTRNTKGGDAPAAGEDA
ncbi:hypothetical protein H8959_019943 [Pygathrix nigripes]